MDLIVERTRLKLVLVSRGLDVQPHDVLVQQVSHGEDRVGLRLRVALACELGISASHARKNRIGRPRRLDELHGAIALYTKLGEHCGLAQLGRPKPPATKLVVNVGRNAGLRRKGTGAKLLELGVDETAELFRKPREGTC